MRYPNTTPLAFSGARRWVETHGDQTWNELCDCDEVLPDTWFNVAAVAAKLPSLQSYTRPELYLRAVLKAIVADYMERPEVYEYPPVRVEGATLRRAMI